MAHSAPLFEIIPPLILPDERRQRQHQRQGSKSDASPIDPRELHPLRPTSSITPPSGSRSSLSPTLPPSLSNPLCSFSSSSSSCSAPLSCGCPPHSRYGLGRGRRRGLDGGPVGEMVGNLSPPLSSFNLLQHGCVCDLVSV